jgi:hypothetical protein
MRAAGVSAAFLLSGMPIFLIYIAMQQTIAAMQTNMLFLASGIRKLTPDDEAEFRAIEKREQDVQDCFYRA